MRQSIEFMSKAVIRKTLSKISGCKSVFSWLMPGQAHLPPLRLAQSARPTPRSCHLVFQSPRLLIHLSNQILSHRPYHQTSKHTSIVTSPFIWNAYDKVLHEFNKNASSREVRESEIGSLLKWFGHSGLVWSGLYGNISFEESGMILGWFIRL